jgi:hypothetical protein
LAVRVFHHALHVAADPVALGRLATQKLVEAGATPLLAVAGRGTL